MNWRATSRARYIWVIVGGLKSSGTAAFTGMPVSRSAHRPKATGPNWGFIVALDTRQPARHTCELREGGSRLDPTWPDSIPACRRISGTMSVVRSVVRMPLGDHLSILAEDCFPGIGPGPRFDQLECWMGGTRMAAKVWLGMLSTSAAVNKVTVATE